MEKFYENFEKKSPNIKSKSKTKQASILDKSMEKKSSFDQTY